MVFKAFLVYREIEMDSSIQKKKKHKKKKIIMKRITIHSKRERKIVKKKKKNFLKILTAFRSLEKYSKLI